MFEESRKWVNSIGNSMVGGMGYLICTEILHRVDIDQLELVARDERINPVHGGLEVPKLIEMLEINAGDNRRLQDVYGHTWPPIGLQTTQNARPSSNSANLDICRSCDQARTLRRILSHNARVIRCKGVIDLKEVQN